MGRPHLVKIGLFAAIGRFESADFVTYARDEQVVCRTDRGLEIGQVLCPIDDDSEESDGLGADAQEAGVPGSFAMESNGELLRRVSGNDQLIVSRIERFRDRAFFACQKMLKERGIDALLVDVEHLFDGQSLFFYFLGDVSEEVQQLTAELSETYERRVKFRRFTETLASGCGPGCGAEASKCGTGGCGNCGAAGGCGIKTSVKQSSNDSIDPN